MSDLLFKEIDNLIIEIKKKCDTDGMTAADLFMILSFEFLRSEIALKNISDSTVSAIREIAATTSHFYYYRDYRNLYNILQDVYINICKLDKRFFDADFPIGITFELNSWQKYVSKTSGDLLARFSISYFIKKDK